MLRACLLLALYKNFVTACDDDDVCEAHWAGAQCRNHRCVCALDNIK